MRKNAILLAVCAAMLVPGIAQAQGTTPADDPNKPMTEIANRDHAKLLTAPDGEASAGITRQPYTISASTDDNVLALTLAPTSQGFRFGSESALNVTVKVPLGAALGGDVDSTVADQGLSGKLSASLSYTLVRTRFVPTDAQESANRRLHGRCDAAKLEWADKPEMGFITRICDLKEDPSLFTRAQLEKLAGNDPDAKAGIEDIVEYNRQRARAPVLLVNVTGSLGTRAYESQDPATFTERSTDRTSVAINVTGGFSFGTTGFFLGGGYQYRRDYSDPQKRVICPPGVTTDCPSEIFDLPTADIDHTTFVLTRFVAPIDLGGVNPLVEVRIAYDFEDKLWGLQVPVYFLTNDDGGFRGGVRFTWESRPDLPPGARLDKPNTSFGVFFVKSFDQLGL